MWGTTDTSKPESIQWPPEWRGEKNLRAQWWKIYAESPSAWKFENHAKGEPPNNTYYLWRFDKPLPEGTKLLLEGDFPHARMFDIQVCAPWSKELPYLGDGTGIPEVPLLDEDIEPDPGHVNPFRAGADRKATKRHFHVTFDLRDGNPVQLNGKAMTPPYRAPGNLRVGCTRVGKNGERGPLVWIRIFLPDHYETYGGVEPPVLRIQLPGKEPVLAPITREVELNIDKTKADAYTLDQNPALANGRSKKEEESLAWLRDWARKSLRSAGKIGDYQEGVGRLFTFPNGELKLIKLYDTAYFIGWLRNIRDPGACTTKLPRAYAYLYGKGQDKPPPANDEHASGHNLYNTYVGGAATLRPNTFLVFTGKAPKTPRTLAGNPTMESSDELRYWNITLQVGQPRIVPVVSITDEQVILDADRRYTIVVGPESSRPKNATAENGISWFPLNIGSAVAINIRSLSTSANTWEHAPNGITWQETDYCDNAKWPTAVKKRMGEYYWRPQYMTKAQVEDMGKVGRTPYLMPSNP